MDDLRAKLLELQAALDTAQAILTQVSADEARLAEDERKILASAMRNVAAHLPRTRADVTRFVDALNAGDDGWLLVRSVPGEHRTDAWYYAGLSASAKKALGIVV